MTRIVATMLALLVSLALASFSAAAADQGIEGAANEAELLESLESLSDGELEALAESYEAVERAQTEANLRSRDAHRDYYARVIAAAADSGELEHETAALLLAGHVLMRGHDLAPVEVDDLASRAMAGAALRPDLLAVLDIACRQLADGWTPENPDATRTPPAACADSDTRRRLTAIEPANAHHWILQMDSAFRDGDREAARTHLLATGRSTVWRPPIRTALDLLHRMLTRWPPDEPLVASARAVAELMLAEGTPSATDAAYYSGWRDPDTFVAQKALELSLILPFGHFQPLTSLCREAVTAADQAGVSACRRLAAMMIAAEDSVIDVMVAYAVLIAVEPPSAAARAEAERDALRAELSDGYHAALQKHGLAQDLAADIRNWIDHGEIGMMRRGLARVEAELAARSGVAPPPL